MQDRQLEVQRVIDLEQLPSDTQLQQWMEAALLDYDHPSEVLIRIVDTEEIAQLNQQYRHKIGTTNILSFPFELPEGVEGIDLLGDLVVCADVLESEAQKQGKKLHDHWAHIIIHGVLHLLGYDHLEEEDATEMEDKEIRILQQLQINNPYQEQETDV